ncbi:hypothetical protein MtrunA17_Chr8g0339581 [Medicago truncatula]|uniref:Transmembrane protein n=1 Tax=Medicago truncatula TaxID=3880 RepID=A0A396GEU5_MEDTR|nr:hypothetical protein MtrunA17_Chr8g0339581 [Medicago truncatula]
MAAIAFLNHGLSYVGYVFVAGSHDGSVWYLSVLRWIVWAGFSSLCIVLFQTYWLGWGTGGFVPLLLIFVVLSIYE